MVPKVASGTLAYQLGSGFGDISFERAPRKELS